MTRTELQTYARMGAAARLQELQSEMAAITAAFPDLTAARSGKRATTAAVRRPVEELPIAAPKARKPYTMTPAARKAVAERMKKYWANRRKTAKQEDAPTEKVVGHRYPKKRRLINKAGQVVANA